MKSDGVTARQRRWRDRNHDGRRWGWRGFTAMELHAQEQHQSCNRHDQPDLAADHLIRFDPGSGSKFRVGGIEPADARLQSPIPARGLQKANRPVSLAIRAGRMPPFTPVGYRYVGPDA